MLGELCPKQAHLTAIQLGLPTDFIKKDYFITKAIFYISADGIKVFYEGRFMSICAQFDNAGDINYLKPHIAIECFLGNLYIKPEEKAITSLIKETLGAGCEHTSLLVKCVSLDETAAEKWVALTRRVASSQEKQRTSDKQLVRHIYDLYYLVKSNALGKKHLIIIGNIVEQDIALAKQYNQSYANNPIHTSQLALTFLKEDSSWEEHWNIFLEQMVYEQNKPTFTQALTSLQLFSEKLLAALTIYSQRNMPQPLWRDTKHEHI